MDLTPEQQEIYVSIWAKTVDTQMHFNEMAVKARQFGLGFVAAALGLGIVLLVRQQEFSIPVHFFCGFNIHVTVLVVLASALALQAVRILDLNVYHKMLRGAVAFGEDFEEDYMKQIFILDKGMTQAVSHFSRHEDAGVVIQNGKYVYSGRDQKNAFIKIRWFYRFTIGTLIVVAILLFVATADFGHPGGAQQPVPSSEKASPHAP
jgi:hypothetical protein